MKVTPLGFFLVAFGATILAQPSPPTDSIQIGAPASGIDIRLPLTVSQCEPFLIYYNISAHVARFSVLVYPPDSQSPFITLYIPSDPSFGILEWVCNVPAGYGLLMEVYSYRYYIVQSGSSSSCLRQLTTTYSYASYSTTPFQLFTSNLPGTIQPNIPASYLATATTPFPTGSFSTITANPSQNVIVTTAASSIASPSATSLTLSPSSSSTPVPPPKKSSAAVPAIVGSVISGIALVFAFIIAVIILERRRKSKLDAVIHPLTSSESTAGGQRDDASSSSPPPPLPAPLSATAAASSLISIDGSRTQSEPVASASASGAARRGGASSPNESLGLAAALDSVSRLSLAERRLLFDRMLSSRDSTGGSTTSPPPYGG